MRAPLPRFVMLLLLAMFAGVGGRAYAGDPRGEARTHYVAGQKAYAAADYRAAIKEFSAAQQLAPADLNNYNLALCYDKLGDAEPAIQYYKEFLAKVPNADKRTEIEASISRLEGALSSASAKRAEETRKADEAHKADEARKADEAAKAAKVAEEARKAEEAKAAKPATDPALTDGPANPMVGVGSTGTPSTGQAVSTGDAQLDRVSAIDVNGIRDQRVGGAGSGLADTHAGPATAAANANPNAAGAPPPPPTAAAGAQASTNPQNPNGQPLPNDQPVKKEQPVYKKWWFWAVVGVSAYVVYSIASSGSQQPGSARAREMLPTPSPANDTGMTLLRF